MRIFFSFPYVIIAIIYEGFTRCSVLMSSILLSPFYGKRARATSGPALGGQILEQSRARAGEGGWAGSRHGEVMPDAPQLNKP